MPSFVGFRNGTHDALGATWCWPTAAHTDAAACNHNHVFEEIEKSFAGASR